MGKHMVSSSAYVKMNGHTSMGSMTDFGVYFSVTQGSCLIFLDKGWK